MSACPSTGSRSGSDLPNRALPTRTVPLPRRSVLLQGRCRPSAIERLAAEAPCEPADRPRSRGNAWRNGARLVTATVVGPPTGDAGPVTDLGDARSERSHGLTQARAGWREGGRGPGTREWLIRTARACPL